MVFRILLFVALIGAARVGAGCVNEAGGNVDWFVMLKYPNSYNYVYADNNNRYGSYGTTNLTSLNNPVGRVVTPMYSGRANYIVYNDQAPGQLYSSHKGHTKGAVIWDGSTIQWLVHSVPKFLVNGATRYAYPPSGMANGQSFLCVTLSVLELEQVAQYLYYTWPNIYSTNVNWGMFHQNSFMWMVLQGKHDQTQGGFLSQEIVTAGNIKFRAFARPTTFSGDIYKDIIAPYYYRANWNNKNMYVETWYTINPAAGNLPSNCTPPTNVYNVAEMNLGGVKYTRSHDHSKWAIVGNNFCVGDLNRFESSTGVQRSGGSLCFNAGANFSKMIHGGIHYFPCTRDDAEDDDADKYSFASRLKTNAGLLMGFITAVLLNF